MVFLNDYSNFRYTKIEVPIKLEQCPSDYECSNYFLDVICDSYQQNNCYIGSQFVEELKIHRLRTAPGNDNVTASEWLFTIIIPEAKSEDNVIAFLDELCEILSLEYAKQFTYFQNHGMGGFSYRSVNVKRKYATENRVFGDSDLNHRGDMSMISCSGVSKNVFNFPARYRAQSKFAIEIQKAFFAALKSTDPVARYILLYYLFEIMFKTSEYKKTRTDIKKQRSRNRKVILCDYLKNHFQIDTYVSFGEQVELTEEILEKIILTRDALAHSADTSQVSDMMYHHMLPILQEVVRSVE